VKRLTIRKRAAAAVLLTGIVLGITISSVHKTAEQRGAADGYHYGYAAGVAARSAGKDYAPGSIENPFSEDWLAEPRTFWGTFLANAYYERFFFHMPSGYKHGYNS